MCSQVPQALLKVSPHVKRTNFIYVIQKAYQTPPHASKNSASYLKVQN